MTDLSSEPEVGYAALIDAARVGDAQALDAALRWIYPKVQAMVHKRLRTNIILKNPWLRPMFSTGDIVQDVFVGVLSTVPKLEGRDEDTVVGYLATTVRNRLMDMMRFHGAARRDGRRHADVDELQLTVASNNSPPHDVEVNEKLAIYFQVLESFEPSQRDLLRSRLEHGQPFDSVAAELGLPSGDTARKQFNELYSRLLVRLGNRGVHAISYDTRNV